MDYQVVENILLINIPLPPQLTCLVCSRTYKSRSRHSDLAKHLGEVHSWEFSEFLLNCACSRRFPNQRGTAIHLKKTISFKNYSFKKNGRPTPLYQHSPHQKLSSLSMRCSPSFYMIIIKKLNYRWSNWQIKYILK